MVGRRGSRVRNPAFGDQPSRAKNIQSLHLNRCNTCLQTCRETRGACEIRRVTTIPCILSAEDTEQTGSWGETAVRRRHGRMLKSGLSTVSTRGTN